MKEREKKLKFKRTYREKRINSTRCLVSRRRSSILFDSLGVRDRYKDSEPEPLAFNTREFLNYDGEMDFSKINEMMMERAAEHRSISPPPPPNPVDENEEEENDDDFEDLESDEDDDCPVHVNIRPPTPPRPRVNDEEDEEGDDDKYYSCSSSENNSETPPAPSYKDVDRKKISLKTNPFEEYLEMHMNVLRYETSLARTTDIIKQSLMWKKCYEIYENYKKEVSITSARPSKFDLGYTFPDDHLDNPNCVCKLCFANLMTINIMLKNVHWGYFIDGAIDCFKKRFSKFMMIQIKMTSQNNYDVVDVLDELICRGFRAIDPPLTILYLEKYFKAIHSTFGLIAGEILTKMSSYAKQNMTYEDAANFMKYYIEIGEMVYSLAEKMTDYLSCLNWKLKAYGLTVRVFILQIYCKLVYELPDVKQMVDRSLKILKLTKNFDTSCLDAAKVHIQTLEDLDNLMKQIFYAKQAWETKSLPFPFEDFENLGAHALKLAALRNPFEETTPNQVESYEILFDKGKGKFELKEANKEELFSSPFLWLPILDASFTNQRDERYSVHVIRSLDYFSFDDEEDEEDEESPDPQPVDNRNRELLKKEFDEKAKHLQAYLRFRASPCIQSVEGRIEKSFDDFIYSFKTPDTSAKANSNVIQYKLDLDKKASNSARLKGATKKAKKLSLPLYSRKYDHGSTMDSINGSLNKLKRRMDRTRGPLEELFTNPFLETLKDKNFIVELLLQVLKLGIRAIKRNTCKVSCAYYLDIKLTSDKDEQDEARSLALKNAMCLQYDILRAFDLLNDHEKENFIYKYYETDKNQKRINISTYIDQKFLKDKGAGGISGKDLILFMNAASSPNSNSSSHVDKNEHLNSSNNSKKCRTANENTGDCISKNMVDSLISKIILKPESRDQIDNIYGVQQRYDLLSDKEKVVIKKVLIKELKKIPDNQFGDDELDQMSSDEIVFFICKMSGCKIPHIYQKKLNKSLRKEYNLSRPKSLIFKYIALRMSLNTRTSDENDVSEPKECPKTSNVQHLCTEHEHHHHHSSAPNSQSSRDEEPERVPSVHASMFNNTSERTIFVGSKHVLREYKIRKERMLKKLLESKATAGANRDSSKSNEKDQRNQPQPSKQANVSAQKPIKDGDIEDIDALVDQIEGNRPLNQANSMLNNDDEKAAKKREKKALKKERREAKRIEEENEAKRLQDQKIMKEREEAARIHKEQMEKIELAIQAQKKLKKQSKKQRQKEREKTEQLAKENQEQAPLEPSRLDAMIELSKKQKKALKKLNNKNVINQPAVEPEPEPEPPAFRQPMTPPKPKQTDGCSIQSFINRGKKTDMVTIRRHPESDSKVTIITKNDQGEDGLLFTLVNGQVFQNDDNSEDGKKKNKKKNKKVKKQQQNNAQPVPQQQQQPVVTIHPIPISSSQVNIAESAATSYSDYTSLHNNGYMMSGISQQPQSSKSFALLSQLNDNDSDDEEIDISRLRLPPGITITKVNHLSTENRMESPVQNQPDITCTPSHSGSQQHQNTKGQSKKKPQNVQHSNDLKSGSKFDASMLTEDDIFGLSRDNKGEFETVISRSKRNKAKVKDGSSIVPPGALPISSITPTNIQEILGLKPSTTGVKIKGKKPTATHIDPNAKVYKYDYNNSKNQNQNYIKQKGTTVNQPGTNTNIKYRTTVYRNSNYQQQQQDFSNVKGYKSNNANVPRFNNTNSYGGSQQAAASNDVMGTMGYFDVNSINGGQPQKQPPQTNSNAWNQASTNYNDFQLQRLENLSLEDQPSKFQKSSSVDPSESLREDAFSTMNEPVHWSEHRLLGPFGSDYAKRDKSAASSPASSNEQPKPIRVAPSTTKSHVPSSNQAHGASRNISFDMARVASTKNFTPTTNTFNPTVAGQPLRNSGVGGSPSTSTTSKLFENPNLDTINTLSKIDEMMVKMVALAEYPEFSNFKLRGPTSNQEEVVSPKTSADSLNKIRKRSTQIIENNNLQQQKQKLQINAAPGAPIAKQMQTQPIQQAHKSPGAIGSDRPTGSQRQQQQQNIFGSIGAGSNISNNSNTNRIGPDQFTSWLNGIEPKYGPPTTSASNPQNGPLSDNFASFLEKYAGDREELDRINRFTDPDLGTGMTPRQHPGAIGQGHHRSHNVENNVNNFGNAASIPLHSHYSSPLPTARTESPNDISTSFSPFYTPNFSSNAVGMARNAVQRPPSTYSPHQMHSSTPTPPPGSSLFSDYPSLPPRPQSGGDITNMPNYYLSRPPSQHQQQQQPTYTYPNPTVQRQDHHYEHFEQIRRNSEGVQSQANNDMNHFWPK